MAKAGMCSECNENVWLTPEGTCPKGHDASCISGVYDAEPQPPAAAPAETAQTAVLPTAAPTTSAPAANAPAATTAPKKKVKGWMVAVIVLGVFALCGALISIGGSGGGSSTSSTPDTAAEAPATKAPAEGADTQAPAVEEPAAEVPAEPAAEKPAEPEMTTGQEAAVQKAQSYLDMESGFSRKGLIEQLKFEGFSTAEAKFAVDRISPDWNTQARFKAESYMQMGGFSKSGLIEQLEFEGFTSAQARYGAKKVGY